jgi:putative tricarboxylic transport membrane protein
MPPISLKKVDIVVSLLVIPICLYVFYESARWPIIDGTGNATWVPRGDAACLMAMAILLFVKALRGRSLTIPSRLVGPDRSRVLWIAVLTGAYTITVEYVGFVAAGIPYMFGFAFVLGERKWVRLILFAVGVPVGAYILFRKALNVPLPEGWFI